MPKSPWFNWKPSFSTVEAFVCHLCKGPLSMSSVMISLPRPLMPTRLLSWVFSSQGVLSQGAIFRGAQLNNQFKVKDIRSKDYSLYPIVIVSNSTLDSTKNISISVLINELGNSQTLFPRHTKLGNTKSLTFKTGKDMSFKVEYGGDANLRSDVSRTILSANISGVEEKIDKIKGPHDCHDPTVKVNIQLTDSGLVEILHSEVQCEIHEKKNLADKFKGFFGAGKEKDEPQVLFSNETPDSRLYLKPRCQTHLPLQKRLPFRWITLKKCDTRKLHYAFP